MTEEEKQYIQTLVKKSKGGTAKIFTITIVGVILLVGVVGSIGNSFIDMDEYINFINAYKPIIITLLTSVGVGYGIKHFKKGSKNDWC